MKSFYKFTILVFLSLNCIAQAIKTNGVSDYPKQINFSDEKIKDYNVHLINLDQHPIPSAEYGTKKQELNNLRASFKHQAAQKSEKKRGLAINPTIFKGVQGNTATGVPNDNDIAVSNGGKVLSVVNSNLRVYDDTLKTLANKSLTALVAGAGVYSWLSDPRVLYDPNADRFILVCFSGSVSYESTILVGFTQTNDPAGIWNFYTLNGNSFNDSTWSDYPIISISDKDLFITFNQVKDNVSWTVGFKQSVIWQIEKQDGYNATPLNYNLWSNINFNGAPLRNICPAKNQTTSMSDTMHFLTLRNVANSNDSIFLTTIIGSHQSGTATINQKLLISPVNYGFPPNAIQKYYTGGTQQYLMTNDARVLAAVYENNCIHFGSNTLNPLHMNAGVYLGHINNVNNTLPTVNATILSEDSVEYGYPSMTYIGNTPTDHKLLYTFSHCFVDSFPGTSVVYLDANGDFSDVIRTKNGTSYINVLTDSTERWGDYTNIQKVYNNPNRAYLSGSWGKAGGMNNWVTIIDNQDFPLATHVVSESPSIELYPNPIQDRFSTNFTLNKAQHVRFEILDMTGKVVSLLLDTYTKVGKNEFSFTTKPLSSGNYIFRISSKEGIVASHKLTIN